MTLPTKEELDALDIMADLQRLVDDEGDVLARASLRLITALRTQLSEVKQLYEICKEQLHYASRRADRAEAEKKTNLQGMRMLATMKDRAEAALAEADAMIEAQAKDHAENNIRLAEMSHRVSQLEGMVMSGRCTTCAEIDVHEEYDKAFAILAMIENKSG